MTVKELIIKLMEFDLSTNVCYLDYQYGDIHIHEVERATIDDKGIRGIIRLVN